MMKKSSFLMIIGVILIIIQAINWAGVKRMYVGLFPDKDISLYYSNVAESNLNLKKTVFAFTAGFDRYISGFEDLTFPEDEYRVPTATQYASAIVRESLGCSEPSPDFGLYIYDICVFIGYAFFGLIGLALFIWGWLLAAGDK